MENLQIMRQTQQTTNMLLVAFMKMNPDLLQALIAASPSPPLMIGSGASGSLLSGSSTQEAEAAQLPKKEADEAAVVHRRIQEHRLTSPAMHPSPAEVRRQEEASVVPESLANLEIDALEIGGGSNELGFEDAAAGSDT